MRKQENGMSGEVFESFVKAVLRRTALEEKRPLYFEYRALERADAAKKEAAERFDAYAPKGYGPYEQPVIFEIRGNCQGGVGPILARAEAMAARYELEGAAFVLILNADLLEKADEDRSFLRDVHTLEQEYRGAVWDLRRIRGWIERYPIEYSNAVGRKPGQKKSQSYRDELTAEEKRLEEHFAQVREAYLEAIRVGVQEHKSMALVLGAGVSVDQGAETWNGMLEKFRENIRTERLLDDPEAVFQKVGGTSLTTAQMCRDIWHDEETFVWQIHKSLYGQAHPLSDTTELGEIAQLAEKCQSDRNFRILTYNYDDFLERYLDQRGVPCCSLFTTKTRYSNGQNSMDFYSMNGEPDQNLKIYHVHGFLPKVRVKSEMDKLHQRSICLTEADYHMLYNQPYSWPIASQLSFFRENVCLFIGCSLSDPNIRRLLELTACDPPRHYAILPRSDGAEPLSGKDLLQVSAHFSRIGVNVLWVRDFAEVRTLLHNLNQSVSI